MSLCFSAVVSQAAVLGQQHDLNVGVFYDVTLVCTRS